MPALDESFGALLIGVVVAGVLYGFTFIQTWYYYAQYPSDPWHVKLLVAVVFLSDTCHQALITHTVYIYLVTNFGVAEELGKVVWSLVVEIFFNGFTTLCVQCFLVLRVHKLSNKNWLATGSLLILVIAQFLLVLVYISKSVHLETFVEVARLRTLSMAVNATATGADMLIAVSLCYLLQRSRTGFRRSDTMIRRLIIFSLSTGLLTSLDAIASLISIALRPRTFIYITFYFCIGRLYCNSLLATLNARKTLTGKSHSDNISLSQGTQRIATLGTSSKRVPGNISIKIDTTHEYVRDELSSSYDVKDHEDV